MIRALFRLLTVSALIATALALPTTSTVGTPASTAEAADLAYFDPGNIVSDAVFFDGLATDVGTVEAFLDAKGAKCVAGEMPCLKDYTQNTADQTGDAYCAAYRGAPNETAAAILVKIGAACGINPRVLLVLLQKEQGLVTGTRPTALKYTKATGFACPDTAACNPAFSGFVSQVYFAARQFDRYAAGVAGSYRAGRNNTVYYHPDLARCGSSQVYIQNKATAGLYSYTPYRPNGAALAAGYGTGDSCSSYGNRNFWNYFTDWFGSTQSLGANAIGILHQSLGGESGLLGAQASGYACGLAGGGCWQQFQNGAIYWSAATGAHSVRGAIRTLWGDQGYEDSFLGYPLIDESCGLASGGCWQQFQNGAIYWSATTGVHSVRGAIRTGWAELGWETSPIGYPITEESCGLASDGCWQQFQSGAMYWSPATGPHSVRGAIRTLWGDQGYEDSFLGYPLIDESCGLASGGCWQQFQNGAIYWSAATGVHSVRGAIRTRWAELGWETSALGYPTSEEFCTTATTCATTFLHGAIVWSSSTGPLVISGAIAEKWTSLGGVGGALGRPAAETTCGLSAAGCAQMFESGTVYLSPATGAHVVLGAIRQGWTVRGAQSGALGYPISDEVCGLTGDGCSQTFQGGQVFWSPASDVHAVSGAILNAWVAQGKEAGSWGPPTGDARTLSGQISQRFSNGTARQDPTSGAVSFG